MLVDTHCHVHDIEYPLNQDIIMTNALDEGVSRIIVVGTDLESSSDAIKFANKYNKITGTQAEAFAIIGVHPSEAASDFCEIEKLYDGTPVEAKKRIIGVGEIGLDYHYPNYSKKRQIEALEWQIDFALRRDLPIEFHVRDAFDDFWAVVDNFPIKNADLHSYTDDKKNADKALGKGFYIGLNGISTFTKLKWQKELYAQLPLEFILLETDAPFLTPVPFRGKVNEPARIWQIAKYHADVRGISIEEVAKQTSFNFEKLFGLKGD